MIIFGPSHHHNRWWWWWWWRQQVQVSKRRPWQYSRSKELRSSTRLLATKKLSQTHYDRDDDCGHFRFHYYRDDDCGHFHFHLNCDGVICTALESDTLYIVGMDQRSRKGRNQLRQRVSCLCGAIKHNQQNLCGLFATCYSLISGSQQHSVGTGMYFLFEWISFFAHFCFG